MASDQQKNPAFSTRTNFVENSYLCKTNHYDIVSFSVRKFNAIELFCFDHESEKMSEYHSQNVQ